MTCITRCVLVWRHLKCRVTEIPNHRLDGWTRIEIDVVSPRSAPLPIAESGHGVLEADASKIAEAGGVVAFVAMNFEREADTRRYAIAEQRWRQLTLL